MKNSKNNFWVGLWKGVKIALSCVVCLLLVVALVCSFEKLILKKDVATMFGYGSLVVVSGSMEPTISVGSLVVIKKQNTYQVGDIISFKDDIGIVTHRIVEVTDKGYITWGDNREVNNVADGEVLSGDVYGKVVSKIARIGFVIRFFTTLEGIICLVAITGVIIAVPMVIKHYSIKPR